jgi:hypothetical protein
MAGVNRFQTNNQVINQVAVEVGLTPQVDVFSNDDPAFTQLQYLLTTACQELLEMFPWQILTREFQKTTTEGEIGKLPLPADFAYMIDQTGWERNENVPLIGPLSSQSWTYLLGRDLVDSTIYASFRFDQNELYIFPQDPMPANLDINFEYISRNLFLDGDSVGQPTQTYSDTANTGSDIPQFPPHLVTRLLKVKFLEAKGFDSQKANDNFWQSFYSWCGKDNSAAILNAAGSRGSFPYLDGFNNVPDTGYKGNQTASW